jgi:hypothetical protein
LEKTYRIEDSQDKDVNQTLREKQIRVTAVKGQPHKNAGNTVDEPVIEKYHGPPALVKD